MLGRIIELSSDGMRVSLERGFLAIDSDAGSGRVALDDIEAVIASAHALSYTNAALAALAERGAPLVICSRSFAPVAVVMPIAGHFEQGARMAAQAAASKPLAKRIWSQIVRAKITAQAEALERVNAPSERLRLLARTIRSGDPANHEAQAVSGVM